MRTYKYYISMYYANGPRRIGEVYDTRQEADAAIKERVSARNDKIAVWEEDVENDAADIITHGGAHFCIEHTDLTGKEYLNYFRDFGAIGD